VRSIELTLVVTLNYREGGTTMVWTDGVSVAIFVMVLLILLRVFAII